MKIVNENLFEFKKGLDPVDSLGIGRRKIIKDFLTNLGINSYRYTIDQDYNITINESLYFNYTSRLLILPDNLTVNGQLWLNQCNINKLPEHLTVHGFLDLRNTAITQLPEYLTVGTDLLINNTKITELPKTLNVKRKIYKDF